MGDRGDPRSRKRFVSAAFKSGLRRYSRELVRSPRQDPFAPVESGPFSAAWHDSASHPGVTAAWLGHCSVLLRMGGVTLLTDPVLSPRIGPRLGRLVMGPLRKSPVPVSVETIPRPGVVLVSHAHFDHLDKPTLRRLASEETHVVTARWSRRLIPRGYAGVREVGWGELAEVGGLRISAIRPRHWGARTAWDRHRGYNSYLVEAGGARVLFAGDTGDTDAFDILAESGGVDLCIFGIGAYDPWEHAHATPEQVWGMFQRLGGRTLLPVHHSTFDLSEEPEGEPMRRLLAAAGKGAGRVIVSAPGEVARVETGGA